MRNGVWAAVVLAVMCGGTARAQVAGGVVSGSIVDEQGLPLPDAVITLSGADWTTDTVSDQAGRFRFPNVAPGAYEVTAARDGFSARTIDDLPVHVGRTSDLAITLRVAAVEAAIDVTAERPVVDPRAHGTATNFTRAELETIPTSRDIFALLRTVPGVLLDRVNVAGNETGQQSGLVSKATRGLDTVWTLDGVTVTDMVSTGSAPIYFNLDNFDEVQVSTAGHDIRQQTGGLGLNLVVRRGTNEFRGQVRGHFSSEGLESANVPDELRRLGVTADTADRVRQIADYGIDLGGPLVRDRAWFYGSWSEQDVRLVRNGLVDRTRIRNPYVKVNWQATSRDLVSVLYFDGDKLKEGRTPSGAGNILFPAATALQNQHNAYAANPFRGLWKVEDNHTFGAGLFATARFAYFNTGFELDPAGGMEMGAGRSTRLSRSFGSVFLAENVRPQRDASVEATAAASTGSLAHEFQLGTEWQRVDAHTRTVWPGHGLLALDNSLTDRRVRVYREGLGVNRVESLALYVADTVRVSRVTLDAGIRFDRQAGAALPSRADGNPAFPDIVPGVVFDGFDLPFVWNTLSPRAGASWAVDEARRWIVRGSISRAAGQLPTALTSAFNPSSSVGFREFRWVDANGDQLASPDEVQLGQQIQVGGGFDPAAPSMVSTRTPNRLGEVRPPRTTSVVGGLDVDLAPRVGVQVAYTYTRTVNHFGNTLRRVGVSDDDYSRGPNLTGTLPDGLTYDIPTWIPDMAAVIAGGGGFRFETWPGYYTDYHGIEATLVRQAGPRWNGRVTVAWNHAREHYAPEGLYDRFGNPTRTDTEPLVDGGPYAPLAGETGQVFLNARWQVSASGTWHLPWELDAAASVFGREGYPFPPFVFAALGVDPLTILVTPQVDTYRLPNLWTTDLRLARRVRVARAALDVYADLFNVFNANTALVRARNAAAANYRQIAQCQSPRILRLGVRVGF